MGIYRYRGASAVSCGVCMLKLTNKELSQILAWLDVGDKAEHSVLWPYMIRSSQMRSIVKELLNRRVRTAKKKQ